MASRDACSSCLRSIRSRAEAGKLPRLSNQQSITATGNTIRGLSTQAVDTQSAQEALDQAFDPNNFRKPRAKKDHSYRTSAGIVLCRSPIITRELSEFEKAFYAYQRHLKSRLSSPFPTDFYFTKGSLASKRWLAGEEERLRANDLVSTTSQSSVDTGDITGEQRELQNEEDIASSVAMSRTTEADRKNDQKSLDRKLDRTLYLLLKKPRAEHAWQFPQGLTGAGEVLHESTSRVLATLAGKDMNTWTVGRVPIGVMSYAFAKPDMGHNGNKVYFLKSRIFAGQCKPQKGANIEDFGWFTREEVEEKVDPAYWKSISSMLASQ